MPAASRLACWRLPIRRVSHSAITTSATCHTRKPQKKRRRHPPRNKTHRKMTGRGKEGRRKRQKRADGRPGRTGRGGRTRGRRKRSSIRELRVKYFVWRGGGPPTRS